MEVRRISSKLAFGIEDAIILFVLLLNLLDFLEVLPDYLDYVKKIISWVILGYLLYRMSITEVFFGRRSKWMDLYLIVAFLLFMLKDVVIWANAALREASTPWLIEFLGLLANSRLSLYGLILGGTLLLFGASFSASRYPFKAPSIISILGSSGLPSSNLERMARFFKVLLVFFGFFVIVFNLLFEWLAIAVDAPLAMIILLVYIFYLVRHAKSFSPQSFLYRVGDAGERFYEHVISHFKYRKTLFLGISGMLILHLLSDFGTFILPFIVGVRDVFYYHALPAHHTLYSLIAADAGQGLVDSAAVVFIHLLNLIAIMFMMGIPAFLWYSIYKQQILRIRKSWLVLFYASLPAFLLLPSFRVVSLFDSGFVGVDVFGMSINSFALTTPLIGVVVSACLALCVLLFSRSVYVRKALTVLMVFAAQIFFAAYTFKYGLSVLHYHWALVSTPWVHFVAYIPLMLSVLFFMAFATWFTAESALVGWLEALVGLLGALSIIVLYGSFTIIFLVQLFFYPAAFFFFEFRLAHHLRRYLRF